MNSSAFVGSNERMVFPQLMHVPDFTEEAVSHHRPP
jgi:hypothetical protein